jgi:hypothetical protein
MLALLAVLPVSTLDDYLILQLCNFRSVGLGQLDNPCPHCLRRLLGMFELA